MVLGSLVVLGEEEKDWKVWVNLPLCWTIYSVQSHWFWKWVASVYQLSIWSGTVSRDMIHFIKGVGIPAAKKLIRTLWSVMLVWVTLLWKVKI